jgi:hypothetical protein
MDSFEGKWAALSEEVLSGMRDWRAQHPQATLREIEREVDSRLAGMRTRLVEEVAVQSRVAAWSMRGVQSPHPVARTVEAPCSHAGRGCGGSKRMAARS